MSRTVLGGALHALRVVVVEDDPLHPGLHGDTQRTQLPLLLGQDPSDTPVEGHTHLHVLNHTVVHGDPRSFQGRTRQLQESFRSALLGDVGIAPDQLADADGKARRLGRLENSAEEHGVHAGAADVVEEGDDLQLSQRLTGDAETTGDVQDHLRGPCSVCLVVARYDPPRTLGVRHVVQGQEGRAVYGREPVFVCHGLASNPPGGFRQEKVSRQHALRLLLLGAVGGQPVDARV